jgi:small subunit ribosomal protein S16
MVKIRLARGGAKKKPFYSIVATDSRKRRDSGYIERLGYFNPVARGQEVRLTIEEDRIEYWTSKGAQTSDRVQFLMFAIVHQSVYAKVCKIKYFFYAVYVKRFSPSPERQKGH